MPITFIPTTLRTASVYASSGLSVCIQIFSLPPSVFFFHFFLPFTVYSAERKKDQVCSLGQYQRVFERLNSLPSGVEHVIIQIGAYTSFATVISYYRFPLFPAI